MFQPPKMSHTIIQLVTRVGPPRPPYPWRLCNVEPIHNQIERSSNLIAIRDPAIIRCKADAIAAKSAAAIETNVSKLSKLSQITSAADAEVGRGPVEVLCAIS